MHKQIVINTGPLISLIAGLGDLLILQKLYKRVIVPYEVCEEIMAKGNDRFDAKVFSLDKWLYKVKESVDINPFLLNSLDKGEASVIQTALNEEVETVCIDEAVGRRIARLNNLKVTGSLGIIISAIRKGEKIDINEVIKRMKEHGVWISKGLEKEANKLINKK